MAITLNDNVSTHAPKPIDARNMDFSGGSAIPFSSVAAALTAVPSAFRHQYLTLWALAPNGDPLEYWFRQDTQDSSLEPKSKESYTLSTDGTIVLKPPYKYDSIVVLPTVNITTLKIGTSSGAGDLEPGTAVLAGSTYTLGYNQYVGANTTIFFTGLTANTKILAYKK